GGVAAALCEGDRVEGLGERADLVDLDENRVCDLLSDAPAQEIDVRHEQVVADELHPAAEAIGERLPGGPVVLGQAVLDRDDRETVGEVGPQVDHAGTVQRAALPLELVDTVAIELARRRVEGDRDLFTMA